MSVLGRIAMKPPSTILICADALAAVITLSPSLISAPFCIADYELHAAARAERGAGIGGEQQQDGQGLERIFPGKLHGVHPQQELFEVAADRDGNVGAV